MDISLMWLNDVCVCMCMQNPVCFLNEETLEALLLIRNELPLAFNMVSEH